MALGLSGLSLLIHAKQAGAMFGDVLMLGRQSHRMEPALLEHAATLTSADFKSVDWTATEWAEPVFEKLGAATVTSLDYSDYEGAALVHDMNRPWPTGSAPRQFDLVFDGGTLEHVFNLPQALMNAMSLVKVGGAFLSVTPSDGWLGHGFHQLQPELFFRFFTEERGFQIKGVWLAEHGRKADKTHFYQLLDPAQTGVRSQVPGRRPLEILVYAEKVAEVDVSQFPWPSQSNYTAMWKAADDAKEGKGPRGSLVSRTVKALVPAVLLDPVRAWLVRRKYARAAKAGWKVSKTLGGLS